MFGNNERWLLHMVVGRPEASLNEASPKAKKTLLCIFQERFRMQSMIVVTYVRDLTGVRPIFLFQKEGALDAWSWRNRGTDRSNI